MTVSRRTVLTGLASLGAAAASPAWAQAIGPQSDPWAQVDPYADPRNGFPSAQPTGQGTHSGRTAGEAHDLFPSAPKRQMSAEDERSEIVGAVRSYAHAINEDGGLYDDDRVQKAIQAFVAPLAKQSDRRHLPWEAHVARSQDINAWTLGGGKLSFNAGLIAMCDHPGELAAVAAHEIGHVDCMHSFLRTQLNRTLAAADQAGMLEQGKQSADALFADAADFKIKNVMGLLRAGFTRDSEYEADEHSLEILRRSGIDPAWAVALMMKFHQHDAQFGHHLVNEVLVDHPHSIERAQNLAKRIALDKKPQGTVQLPGWDVLKSAFPTPPKWRNA